MIGNEGLLTQRRQLVLATLAAITMLTILGVCSGKLYAQLQPTTLDSENPNSERTADNANAMLLPIAFSNAAFNSDAFNSDAFSNDRFISTAGVNNGSEITTAVTYSSVTVTWDAIPITGPGYVVQLLAADGSWLNRSTYVGKNAPRTVTFNDLDAETSYIVRLIDAGVAILDFVTVTTASRITTSVTESSVTATWAAIPIAGSGYVVQLLAADGSWLNRSQYVDRNAPRTVTFDELNAETSYIVRLIEAAGSLLDSASVTTAVATITNCADIDVTRAPFNSPDLQPTFAFAETLRDPRVARASGRNPHTHGVNLYVPANRFPEQTLLNCGFLDITQPPFSAVPYDLNAASNNVDAINRAMKAAREYMLVTYLPSGTYFVDDTLTCVQGLSRQAEAGQPNSEFNFREDRNGACVLQGSTRGPRPTIALVDGSFSTAPLLKPLLFIWARDNADDNKVPGNNNPCGGVVDPNNPLCDGKPNGIDKTAPGISFNNMVIGINFDLGENNPNAVAIDLDGAQGSGIEDVTIYARSGYAGLTALPAAGGATHNLTVIGGKFGIDTLYQNERTLFLKDPNSLGSVPTLSGSTFEDQSVSAIRYSQLESLSMVGVKIKVANGNTNPAIQSRGGLYRSSLYAGGVMSIVDTSIDFESFSPENVAIRSFSSLHLDNVYTRNTDQIVIATEPRCGDRLACIAPGLETILRRNHVADDWHHIDEYAVSIRPWDQRTARNGITQYVQYEMPIYLNGARQTAASHLRWASDTPVDMLPADLQSKHQWGGDFPQWDGNNVINVKLPPYRAAGDGIADDTAVLQQAINDASASGRTLFLPKGYYRVTQPIELKRNSRIVGAARHLSHILAEGFSQCQNDPAARFPLLTTPQQGGGTVRMAFLTVNVPWEETCAYPLHWQLGGDNIIRSINIKARSRDTGYITNTPPDHPQVLINNNGAGRWYTNFRDSRYEWSEPSPNFRWIKVDNTVGPFTFYQVNPEGQGKGGFAKMEIVDSSNITIYGFKDENRNPALRIVDSNHISLFGYGGIPFADQGQSLFEISGSTQIRLAGLVNRANNPSNDGTPEITPWYMVSGSIPWNVHFSQTATLDRPILFVIE